MPATGFPPYIALTSLDDTDTLVKNAYSDWLIKRRDYNSKHSDGDKYNAAANGCFASAIALLLGGGNKSEERTLVSLLKRSVDAFRNTFRNNHGDDLPIFIKDGEVSESPHNVESPFVPSALDYMAGVSLAWLYAKRQADKGSPVTTDGFPTVPSNIQGFSKAVIPKEVWQYYQKGNTPIDFRIIDIQNSIQADTNNDLDLFTDAAPEKSMVPSPVLVPSPDLTRKQDIDFTITVDESDGDGGFGVYLRDGDVFEFSEIGGTIWTVVLLAGRNGPDGWTDRVEYDTKFPLHSYLDPVNAHRIVFSGSLTITFL